MASILAILASCEEIDTPTNHATEQQEQQEEEQQEEQEEQEEQQSETPTIVDSGIQPAGDQTVKPHFPDLIHEAGYHDFYNPVQDDIDLDYGNVDYICGQGKGTAFPTITNDGYLLLYQGTASKGGAYINIRSHNGASLRQITIGTATKTKISHYEGDKISTRSETKNLSAGDRYTYNCSEGCTQVCFTCMGTEKSERMTVDSIRVVYKGGLTAEDYNIQDAEYGPLMKVIYPFTEDFEDGFPSTEKPTYNKYGLTAGRENLQWSTWYGSFSYQNAIQGGQSIQLRVYQYDEDYEKPQFGHAKMEFFLKDLRKVSFKYSFSEFWNKATISYCEFGSTEWKNPVEIKLASYGDRGIAQTFTYVLDEGKAHDAKILIKIDPSTGYPTKDHYDFIFDSFVFE